MAFQDRHYYRDGGGATGNPLMWLLTGSVPLFTVFGIRVRAHALFLVFIGLVLLFGLGRGSTVQDRVVSMTILFGIVLLHEFGHCFAARWTGGSANDILMTPLGGLAMTMARRKPWPTFVTVAGGPLVNVVICILTAIVLLALGARVPLNPYGFWSGRPDPAWINVAFYLYWIYIVSYFLLLFNLLPVFPLDGGQLLQSILWKPMGYYKSMLLTVNIGLVGAVLLFMYGLGTLGAGGGVLVIMISVFCFMNCLNMRRMLIAEGPWGFSEEDTIDYSASLRDEPDRPSRLARWKERKAEKQQAVERAEQRKIDAILAKVSAHGMQSLTWLEKRTLRKATERQRQHDAERESRYRRSVR